MLLYSLLPFFHTHCILHVSLPCEPSVLILSYHSPVPSPTPCFHTIFYHPSTILLPFFRTPGTSVNLQFSLFNSPIYHLSLHAFIQSSTNFLPFFHLPIVVLHVNLQFSVFHSPTPSIPTSQSRTLLVWRVTARQTVSVVLTFFSLLSGQRAWRTTPLLL